MSLSDEAPIVIVSAAIAIGLVGGATMFKMNEKVRKEMLDIRTNEIAQDIYLVSNFNEGHIQKDLGANYRYSFPSDDVLKVTYRGRSEKQELKVEMASTSSFESEKVCVNKTSSGVELSGGAC